MNEISSALPSHLTDLPKTQERARNTLAKDDFMKLLMTQLQNQDPLRPMDHHEFASQLAQFGSLEQLQNIQSAIRGLATGIGDGAKFNALELIGKRVEASGSELELVQGQSVAVNYTPKEGITPVKALIYGDGGKLVREVPIDPRSKASQVEWDGKDSDGKALNTGRYSFRVQGIDRNGLSSELSSELGGKVSGVDMNGQVPVLVVKTAAGETRIELTKVKSVLNDETGTAGHPPSRQGSSSGPVPLGQGLNSGQVPGSSSSTVSIPQQSIPIDGDSASEGESEVPDEGEAPLFDFSSIRGTFR